MTGDVPRHEVKKGAPDYRGMFREEVLEHQATSRKLAAKDANEVNLLKKIEELREENQELNKADIIHIKTECLQCVKMSGLQKDKVKLTKENKTMFKYVVSMAVITIMALSWAIMITTGK